MFNEKEQLKSILTSQGHPEIYDKCIEAGIEKLGQASQAFKDTPPNLLEELGVEDALKQKSIINKIDKQNVNNMLIGFGVLIILIPIFFFILFKIL